jgi:hypothetical protein
MRTKRTRQPANPRGLHVVGPGFYLWDSDPQEALRLANELRRRPLRVSALRRRASLPAPLA